MSITKKRYKLTKMGVNTYYFRIDVYFTKYLLAVEIDEKSHVTEILFLRRSTRKKNVNLLELIGVSVMIKIIKLVE